MNTKWLGFVGRVKFALNTWILWKKSEPRYRGREFRARREANANALRETLAKFRNKEKVECSLSTVTEQEKGRRGEWGSGG